MTCSNHSSNRACSNNFEIGDSMTKPESHGLDNCGEVIKRIRKSRDMTASQLVTLLGGKWSADRLSKIENSKLPISRGTIHQIADALRMPPERLYLMCLKEQYPALKTGEIGELLENVVENIPEMTH